MILLFPTVACDLKMEFISILSTTNSESDQSGIQVFIGNTNNQPYLRIQFEKHIYYSLRPTNIGH